MSKQKITKTRPRGCGCGLPDARRAPFFKALGDPNRIAILARLARDGGPCCVSRVAECCPVNISVVSRHLAILREAGIVSAEKSGKEVYYTVCFTELSGTLRAMADAIDACCPPKRRKQSVSAKRGRR